MSLADPSTYGEYLARNLKLSTSLLSVPRQRKVSSAAGKGDLAREEELR